jgi:hypothetical protein
VRQAQSGFRFSDRFYAWPDGLQAGLTDPVCILVDEGKTVEDAASLAGFMPFSSIRAFRRDVKDEILHESASQKELEEAIDRRRNGRSQPQELIAIMKFTICVPADAIDREGGFVENLNSPSIHNFQVCRGGNGWPTPYEVGIYLDAEDRQGCIIDWKIPCKPIRFDCEYGSFLVYLDTANKEEIEAAETITVNFFSDT